MDEDPALVFWEADDRPGTHVLLVGIGDYPWLEDGSAYDPAKHEDNAMGMAQLGAPPASVQRLANWFLSSFSNPDRELASLALVISAPEPVEFLHAKRTASPAPCPRGTADEIANAATKWIERGGGRQDNALVFAFCGHGIQSGDPVLLCRDYGSNTENRFGGAINFEQFRIALSSRLPEMQVLFVDACRTPDTETDLLGEEKPGNPLLARKSLSGRGGAPAMQSVHFATSLYTEAWSRPDGVSLFTESLEKALDGGAAEAMADWWVTTGRLHIVLNTYLQRYAESDGVMQRPAAQTEEFALHKPPTIKVDLYVTSAEPGIWHEPVQIDAVRSNATVAGSFSHRPPPAGQPTGFVMQLVNPSQKAADVRYNICAKFDPVSQFEDCTEEIIAYPPHVLCPLPVSKRP